MLFKTFCYISAMFAIFCSFVMLLGAFALVIVATWRLICYIRTEKRMEQLESSVSELNSKLRKMIKEIDDDRGNLQ